MGQRAAGIQSFSLSFMIDYPVLVIFVLVYLGMILGGLPRLALDRTGVALLGAIALLALGRLDARHAWDAVDVPTIALLFALMVVSAQLRLGGWYTSITRRIAGAAVSAPMLLALLIAVAGGLSAVLTNDIVCLAMSPILIEGCVRRRLDPLPFLLGLACASNIGSAATLIGNPQNILVGQALQMSFGGYMLEALPPVIVSMGVLWGVLVWQTRGAWERTLPAPPLEGMPYDHWQSTKGVMIIVGLMILLLVSPWPREILAMTAAGIVLLSRRTASRSALGLVDWQLLVLFIGLFIVNHAFEKSGMAAGAFRLLHDVAGIDARQPFWLFLLCPVLSAVVSNVPAVMLLLPVATHPLAGTILALSSTLAGNLLVVGSIANIIVVEQAGRLGIEISWSRHARTGIPVTLATLGVSGAWLWLLAR